MQKSALVSDFDGTISDNDFFWYVIKQYLTPDDIRPWEMYQHGRITHFEALRRIFAKIRVPEKELLAFIDTINVDRAFGRAAAYCRRARIPVYIASAGCDYYICRLIGDIIAKNRINLVTNMADYSETGGLRLKAPEDSPFYDAEVGVSKVGVVRLLQQQGFKVVFAGDSHVDLPAAELADAVFAKDFLLRECQQRKIAARPLMSFDDIIKFFEEQ